MGKSIMHIACGRPHYGRGKKSLVYAHWTRSKLALAFGFLLLVALTVIVGMYFGWLSSQEEERSNSPETKVSAPQK